MSYAPESLDSRLSRDPSSISGARAIVLDEIHVLDGTPRGDQLRILVSRFRRLSPCIQVVAASATTADPEGVAGRYLSDAVVVQDPGRNPIRSRIIEGDSSRDVAREVEAVLRSGARKLILFTNSRESVERYASALGRVQALRDIVIAHHGSLSRKVRQSAERRLLSSPRAVCVATMTLELGIDVGDVDVVGLIAPPPDVASLVQRAGRSGRRGRGPRLLCFAHDEGDVFRYRVMLDLARSGRLASDPYCFRPSVLVQQAMSILHQNEARWVSAPAIRSRLDPGLAGAWSEERVLRILEQMVEEEWLISGGRGRFVVGDRCERLWQRGLLHSNIDSTADVEVVDSLTGETLGNIATFTGLGMPDGPSGSGIRMAGRGRQVLKRETDRIIVGRDSPGQSPTFPTKGAPVTSMALAREMAIRLGIADGSWPVLICESGSMIFHFLGTAGGEILASAIKARTGSDALVARGPYAVVLAPDVQPFIPEIERDEIVEICHNHHRRLARVLGMGPYHHSLPADIAGDSVVEACQADGILDALTGAHLDELPDEHPADLWIALALKETSPGRP
jgi:ATP-dependent Lhr-like helicase